MDSRFEQRWAVATGVLCFLVMIALAFTGLLALAAVAAVVALSFGCRWLITRVRAR
jgi:Flp pilus assembly protein TadB